MVSPPDPELLARRLTRFVLIPLSVLGGIAGAVPVGGILRALDPLGSFDVDEYTPTDPTAWQLVVVAIATGCLTALALRVPLKAPRDRALRKLVFACVFFGWLNSPVCLFASSVSRVSPTPEGILGGIVGGGFLSLVVGAFIAVPLGLVYALGAAYPIQLLVKLQHAPTLDARARVIRAVGVVTLASGAASALLAQPLADAPQGVALAGVLAALAVAGGVAMTAAHLQIARHARFLARVREGAERDWAVVPLPETETPKLARALVGTAPDAALLVRLIDETPGGAYRATPLHVPWATVPGAAGKPATRG